MQLINISALSLLVAAASAADCFGNTQKGISQWGDAYWDARAKMCANTDCAYQQDCTTHSSKTIRGLASVTVNVSLSRKKTGSQKGFKDCWVRCTHMPVNENLSSPNFVIGCHRVRCEMINLICDPSNKNRNIINQCVNTEQKLSGTWEANGQLYQINAWYS